MASDGYGFRLNGVYCVTLTTSPAYVDGRQDIYFGPIGADTHEHVWVKLEPIDATAMGTRLKDGGQAASSGHEINSLTTEVLAQIRITWDPFKCLAIIELVDIFSNNAYAAKPIPNVRTQSSRDLIGIDIPAPPEAKVIDCQLALRMCSDETDTINQSPQIAEVQFGPGSPFNVALSVTNWSKVP